MNRTYDLLERTNPRLRRWTGWNGGVFGKKKTPMEFLISNF
ncbi:MAG: hypothetical protein FD170_1890 [Bacteroidetes bacterium]|nr:MAG: hypothetical protein FD170_1890 [Bacteroidota bacterium]